MEYDWRPSSELPQQGRRIQVSNPPSGYDDTGVVTYGPTKGRLLFRPDDYDDKRWPGGFRLALRGDWRYLPDPETYHGEDAFQRGLDLRPSYRLLQDIHTGRTAERDRASADHNHTGGNVFHVTTARVKEGTVGQVVQTDRNRIVWQSDPQTDTKNADGVVTVSAQTNATNAAQDKIDSVVDGLFA